MRPIAFLGWGLFLVTVCCHKLPAEPEAESPQPPAKRAPRKKAPAPLKNAPPRQLAPIGPPIKTQDDWLRICSSGTAAERWGLWYHAVNGESNLDAHWHGWRLSRRKLDHWVFTRINEESAEVWLFRSFFEKEDALTGWRMATLINEASHAKKMVGGEEMLMNAARVGEVMFRGQKQLASESHLGPFGLEFLFIVAAREKLWYYAGPWVCNSDESAEARACFVAGNNTPIVGIEVRRLK